LESAGRFIILQSWSAHLAGDAEPIARRPSFFSTARTSYAMSRAPTAADTDPSPSAEITSARSPETGSDNQQRHATPPASRRSFLQTTSLGATAALAANPWSRTAHAAGIDSLRVGLIGCGGRGNGAAGNAMQADPAAQLTAIGDLFEPRVRSAQRNLERQLGEQFQVADDRAFHGFDAYKQVIDSGVDVVILATPPFFRPDHLEYAIERGCHVFCEKPVAVDPVGVDRVRRISKMAEQRGLNLVSGLCWRYDYGVRETMKRILDGQIGQILSIQENYLTGTLWSRGPNPDWTPMENQLQNWLYYRWLSGDHIAEQFIHSLDKALWMHHDVPPVMCCGTGGRQVRTGPQFGDVYDHFAVVYEWADGTRAHAYTRQMDGCFNETEDFAWGTKGHARVLANTIAGDQPWRYERPQGTPNMYDSEHNDLFQAIRQGKVINNGGYMCDSTLMAIMGREACYSGEKISWQDMLDSRQDLTPARLEFGEAPPVVVHQPGQYSFLSGPFERNS
jgi:myo-inositol 2-dehydrogenase / D-chiro-inositol 1-dehydrogenase